DPFGSPLPYLRAAVNAVVSGGVLAVASTDMGVLCGQRGSQVCRSSYGASVAPYPYAKEGALRVLLLRLEVLARESGRRVVPLLCVAVDFYV
ncbi:unnamed protein product, partial [Discosporangium mesarthrocarpum]